MRLRLTLFNGALLDLAWNSDDEPDDDPPVFGFSQVGTAEISDDRMLDNIETSRKAP